LNNATAGPHIRIFDGDKSDRRARRVLINIRMAERNVCWRIIHAVQRHRHKRHGTQTIIIKHADNKAVLPEIIRIRCIGIGARYLIKINGTVLGCLIHLITNDVVTVIGCNHLPANDGIFIRRVLIVLRHGHRVARFVPVSAICISNG